MDLKETKARILAAVDRLAKAHDELWVKPQLYEPPMGYWEHVDHLLEVVEESDIPAELKPLERAVKELDRALETVDHGDVILDRSGYVALYEKVQLLRRQQQPKIPTMLEPVADLFKLNGMRPEQVAKMYGFIRADGTPDVRAITQERDKPGSVLGKQYPDPNESIRRQFQEEEAIAARVLELLELDPSEDVVAEEPQECPETYEELFSLKGMTIAQIARMKGVEQNAVVQMAHDLGVKRDATGNLLPLGAKGEVKPETSERRLDPLSQEDQVKLEEKAASESDGVEEQARELFLEGRDKSEIKDQTGIDGRRLRHLVKQWEAEREEVSA